MEIVDGPRNSGGSESHPLSRSGVRRWRRRVAAMLSTRPSNTCNSSFERETIPASHSEARTRGKMSRITKAIISVTLATRRQRYERSRNVQRFESPRRWTHMCRDESRHDGINLARGVENEACRDCGRTASDQAEISRNVISGCGCSSATPPSPDAGLPPSCLRFAARAKCYSRPSGWEHPWRSRSERRPCNNYGAILISPPSTSELQRRSNKQPCIGKVPARSQTAFLPGIKV